MRLPLFILALAGTLTTACASRAPKAPRITAPTMLPNARPAWQVPPSRGTGVVVDMRITVRVDSTGLPRMETLQVTGIGAELNRDAAREWVRSARFRPAQQAGRAVEGIFEARIQARSAVRRIGSIIVRSPNASESSRRA